MNEDLKRHIHSNPWTWEQLCYMANVAVRVYPGICRICLSKKDILGGKNNEGEKLVGRNMKDDHLLA